MRKKFVAGFVFALFAMPVAVAAPTCLNIRGETVRCDAPGAMPVGWVPSPEQRAAWQQAQPPGPGTDEVLNVVAFIVLLLALIALLPEFSGWDADQKTPDDS